MRILRGLLIALMTAFAGCILALFVGEYLTKPAHVPEMEGQRGMTVFFVGLPLGIIAGLIIGITVAILVRRSLLASIDNEPVASQCVELKNLPHAPRKQDQAWSDWIFATERADLTPILDSECFAIRYRLHPIER